MDYVNLWSFGRGFDAKNVMAKIPKSRVLILENPRKQKYVQYSCTLKEDVTESDIREFNASLDKMKLDSSMYSVNGIGLKEGRTTADLKKRFYELLESDFLSFDRIVSLYDFNESKMKKEKKDTTKKRSTYDQAIELASQDSATVNEPVLRFLSFFDIEEECEYTQRDLIQIIEIGRLESAYKGFKRQLESIHINTQLFRNVLRKNTSNVKGIVKAKK